MDSSRIESHAISRGWSPKTASQVSKAIKGMADAMANPQKPDKVIGGLSSLAGNSADAVSLKMTGLVFGELAKTMSLGKALNFTPARAGAFIAITVFDKTLKAANLIDDRDFSECQKAMASLATDLALGMLAVPTGWAAPFALTAIFFSSYDMSNKCIVPRLK